MLRLSYNNQIQTNCEDQDKMLQCVAFYQGLYYLAEVSLRVHVHK